MDTKTFIAPIELKQDSEDGEFKATFATLNTIDLDNDVTVDGAFKTQSTLVETWNHGRDLPAGKGEISVDGDKAIVKGKFFLNTGVGTENYQTVKNLGDLTEWSYTFRIIKSDFGIFEGEQVRFLKELDVIGVSPVSRGAGVDTRTDSIKNQKEDDKTDGAEDAAKGEAKGGKPRSFDVEIMVALAEIIHIKTGGLLK